MSRKKSPCKAQALLYVRTLVSLDPLIDLGLSQAQDVLVGVGRSLAAADVQEIQAAGGLVQIFLVAGRIAQLANNVLLDQSSSLGVVLLLADDLLHDMNLLSEQLVYVVIIHICVRKSS